MSWARLVYEAHHPWNRDLDPFTIEPVLDAAAQLALRIGLRPRIDIDPQPQHEPRIREPLHTGDPRLTADHRFPGGILDELAHLFTQQGQHAVDILAVGDGDVDHGPRPLPREVRDDGDLAVGDEMRYAIAVAQRRRAERQPLHRPFDAGDP